MPPTALAQTAPAGAPSPNAADAVLATVMRLNAAMEALAALGAVLQGGSPGRAPHPAIAAPLAAVPRELIGDGELPEPARAAAAGAIRGFFHQALDLLEHPEAAPGWHHTDPAVLLSQGRGSAVVAEGVAGIAAGLPGLQAGLDGADSCMLDVGTGVAGLALAMARRWPGLRLTGIDTFDPALAMARQAVAASGLGERIELRAQDVGQLDDQVAFDLAWVPAFFIAQSSLHAALPRLHAALKPGGWLLIGQYAGVAGDGLSAALAELRAIRGGGHPWPVPALATELNAAGFEPLIEPQRTWAAPLQLIAARRRFVT